MQFVEDLYKSIWPHKTFPGIQYILINGSDREQHVSINALNIMGVNEGIRKMCYFVGYMYGPNTLSDGTLLPDDDPPVGSEKQVHLRIGTVIRKYCKHVVYKKGGVIAKDVDEKLLKENNEYLLLGYHGGQKGETNGEFVISVRVRLAGSRKENNLYSWTSSGSNTAIAASYQTLKKWQQLITSIHPNLIAQITSLIRSAMIIS
jgi:hypothetical protein